MNEAHKIAVALAASKYTSQIDLSDGFTPTTSYRTLTLDTLSEKDDFRSVSKPARLLQCTGGIKTCILLD